MTNKLLIISIDALGASRLSKQLNHLPNIQQLIQTGTWIQNVEAIYPSLTYPSHTTIVTGVYPSKHGIVNNTYRQPSKQSPDWFWYDQAIQSPTIYQLAKQQGLTTAAFLWPVTARSKIDYNIAEIFPNRIWTNQVLVSLNASTPQFLIQMNKRYGHLRRGIKQPFLDDFITACAVDTIKSKKPDLTLIHLVDLDSACHAHGTDSKEANEALLRQDKRIGLLLNALKEACLAEQTNIAILGDHSQLNVHTMIRLNAFFVQKDWLKLTKKGRIPKKTPFYAKSADGSAYIYQQGDTKIKSDIIYQELLKIEGIESIYQQPVIHEMGADPEALFMVEAKPGYYFIDEAVGHVIEKTNHQDIGQSERYRAVHGYHPSKDDYQTTLLFSGPDIKENQRINQARLIDEAPTFAKLLKLNNFPKNSDGDVIQAIFK
ncbi:alkaline phosphatase family protein [Vagococcus penaei]|uniref:Alkaline phosphatase family protein n=2 Tax=Vagococcus penaei TaxID=633807 RepID=A0A1Q2D364_9ENTE|nr:alkaline phosphatase family protein [Vagococcus penaei]RSU01125.1 alkaline phosphatase family protein [Vagococcus penaei]